MMAHFPRNSLKKCFQSFLSPLHLHPTLSSPCTANSSTICCTNSWQVSTESYGFYPNSQPQNSTFYCSENPTSSDHQLCVSRLDPWHGARSFGSQCLKENPPEICASGGGAEHSGVAAKDIDWRIGAEARSFGSQSLNENPLEISDGGGDGKQENVSETSAGGDDGEQENPPETSAGGGGEHPGAQAKDINWDIWSDEEKQEDEEEEEGFASIAVLEEELRALQEADPDDPRIGIASLRLAQEYDLVDEDPEKILHLAQQALKIFGVVNDDSLHVGMCLDLIGTSYFRLGKLEVSLDNLRRSLRFFEKKEQEGKQVDPFKMAVLRQMGSTNSALDNHNEAADNFCEALEIQEALMDHDDPQLAINFKQAAEACSDALRFSEAQLLIERAIELHKLSHGEGSVEEAHDRQLLSIIFVGLNDYEKSLEQLQIARNILAQNDVKEASALDISIADAQITLGRYEEAIATLLALMERIPESDPMRAMMHVNLAKSYFQQKNVGEARQHCNIAFKVFMRYGETDLLAAGKGLMELASVHETMNELEKSIEVLKQALAFFKQISAEVDEIADVEAHIGMQLIFLGKLEAGLPYLERSAEQLQKMFGKEHQTVARVLNQIGLVYLELEKHSVAVNFLERAKGIMSNSHGPGHPDTISVMHNLVNAYSAAGRNDLAIQYQRQIISEWASQGDAAKSQLEDAKLVLDRLSKEGKTEMPPSVEMKSST